MANGLIDYYVKVEFVSDGSRIQGDWGGILKGISIPIVTIGRTKALVVREQRRMEQGHSAL